MSSARARLLTWALLPLVVAGAAGFVAQAVSGDDAEPLARGAGPAWSVRTADGRVAELPVAGAGLLLRPGAIFRLDDDRDVERRYTDAEFRVAPGERHSSTADVRFGDPEGINYRLVVVPALPVTAFLSARYGAAPWESLAQQELRILPGEVNRPRAFGVDEAAALPTPTHDLRLRLRADGISAWWDGRQLLRVPVTTRPAAPDIALWMDDARLLAVSAAGEDVSEFGLARGFTLARDFTDFGPQAQARRRSKALLTVGCAVLLAALYLRSRVARRTPLPRLLRALLALLAPIALPLALAAWLPQPPLVVHTAAAALAVPGLLFALLILRETDGTSGAASALRLAGSGAAGVQGPDEPRPQARQADASTTPSRRALAASWTEGWLGVLAVLIVGGAACAAGGAAAATGAGHALHAAQAWLPRLASTGSQRTEPLTLDASNALELTGVQRDMDLRARVRLDQDAVLEVRLRAPDNELVAGTTLCLSADERVASGFVHESSYQFRPIGNSSGALPSGQMLELEVRARGSSFAAFVDGREVASATDDEFPAGKSFVLAAAGSVRVENLSLQPIAAAATLPDPDRARIAGTAVPLALLIVLAALARMLLRQPLLQGVPSVVFLLVPLALALHSADGETPLSWNAVAWTGGATALLALLHAPSLRLAAGPLRCALFATLSTAALLFTLRNAVELPRSAPQPTSVHQHEFSVPRLAPGLVSFQHPALRRMNTYLRAHRFRGRSFPIEKPAGTLRVLCVGSSSTFGFALPEESRLDYPAVLEDALKRRAPDLAVEVINGAIQGTSSARMLWFFREVLLQFSPDIVTLSFTCNDAYNLTQLDEGAYLRRITADGHVHDAAARQSGVEQAWDGRLRLDRLRALFAVHPGPTLPLWQQLEAESSTPPDRFAANLREYARLCAERGILLVLVKEPFRDDQAQFWKDEFYAAIDAVATEFGLAVVDPRPALVAAGATRGALFLDEVHPTVAGHAVIAETLLPVIEPLLRGIPTRRR